MVQRLQKNPWTATHLIDNQKELSISCGLYRTRYRLSFVSLNKLCITFSLPSYLGWRAMTNYTKDLSSYVHAFDFWTRKYRGFIVAVGDDGMDE
jgi:hypothetical protein